MILFPFTLSSKASFSGLMANALFLALAVVAAFRGIALWYRKRNSIGGPVVVVVYVDYFYERARLAPSESMDDNWRSGTFSPEKHLGAR